MSFPDSQQVVDWFRERFGIDPEPVGSHTASDVAYEAYYIDSLRISSLNN